MGSVALFLPTPPEIPSHQLIMIHHEPTAEENNKTNVSVVNCWNVIKSAAAMLSETQEIRSLHNE